MGVSLLFEVSCYISQLRFGLAAVGRRDCFSTQTLLHDAAVERLTLFLQFGRVHACDALETTCLRTFEILSSRTAGEMSSVEAPTAAGGSIPAALIVSNCDGKCRFLLVAACLAWSSIKLSVSVLRFITIRN